MCANPRDKIKQTKNCPPSKILKINLQNRKTTENRYVFLKSILWITFKPRKCRRTNQSKHKPTMDRFQIQFRAPAATTLHQWSCLQVQSVLKKVDEISVGIGKKYLHDTDNQYLSLFPVLSLFVGINRYVSVLMEPGFLNTYQYMQILQIPTMHTDTE